MTTVPERFRKRPVVIEAMQWTGDNFDALFAWGTTPDLSTLNAKILLAGDGADATLLAIATLEGTHSARIGDWIIKGIKGEFYPCKPDIFMVTYELVP